MLNLDFVHDRTSAFCMSTFIDESGCGYGHVAYILQETWYCQDDCRLEACKRFSLTETEWSAFVFELFFLIHFKTAIVGN